MARASAPFRFLRPFKGCVPQPMKKRRLFDSHNPNSLMVAELRATIPPRLRCENQARQKSKEEYPYWVPLNFRFLQSVSALLTLVKNAHSSSNPPAYWRVQTNCEK